MATTGYYINRRESFLSSGMMFHNPVADIAAWTALSTVARGSTVPLVHRFIPETWKSAISWQPFSAKWQPWLAQKVEGWGAQSIRGRALNFLLGKDIAVGSKLLPALAKEAGVQSTQKLALELGVTGTIGLAAAGLEAVLMAGMYQLPTTLMAGGVTAFAQYGTQKRHEGRQSDYTGGLEMYGRGFQDSQAAATMRGTMISMLNASQLGIRRALGREAYYMHDRRE